MLQTEVDAECKPGSVLKLKPKLHFLGETEPDGCPSIFRFWGRTRLTDDVAHSLNDAVFKLFLILTVV